MSAVNSEMYGDVAVITVDSPPVNALSQSVREGLLKHVMEAEADDDSKAIVQQCPLVRGLIGQELAGLIRGRQRTDHVQEGSPEENGVGAWPRGLDSQVPQARQNSFVDLTLRRRGGIAFERVRPCSGCHPVRGRLPAVACQ